MRICNAHMVSEVQLHGGLKGLRVMREVTDGTKEQKLNIGDEPN